MIPFDSRSLVLRLLAIVLLTMIPVSPIRAQQKAWDYIGAGFGGSDFHIRDDHASPMIFSAWGIAPELLFMHAGEQTRQYFEGSYYSAALSTTSDNFRTDTWGGRVRYAYLQSIGDFGDADHPLRLFLGGSLNSFLSGSHYYFFIKPLNAYGSSIDSWYWSHSLDAALHLEYALAERRYFSLQCYMPLLSNVSRPQYSPSGDFSYTENVWKMKMFGRTEFFPKNVSCDILFAFQFPVLWRFNVQVSYEFFFASYDLPRELKMYMNNARGGIFYCF